MPKPELHVSICTNNRPAGHPRGSCTGRGAQMAFQRLLDETERRGLYPRVLVTASTCTGPCELGPVMVVHPGGHWYREVDEEAAVQILEAHLDGSGPVARQVMPDSAWDK